ncbi:MAG: hypothetical protein ACPGYT_12750 [Nitrospirales bacterium]
MTRWIIILIFLSLSFSPTFLWAHGGNDHILGTVTETTDHQIVVKTPKGESVSITIQPETGFHQNGISTKDARPQVGDRLVAEVSKNGDHVVGKEIRFSTPKAQ